MRNLDRPAGHHRGRAVFLGRQVHRLFDALGIERLAGDEGSPREPVHVHVVGAGGEAKYWVSPVVALAESNGFDARTLRELLGVVEQNVELIERAWNEHFC